MRARAALGAFLFVAGAAAAAAATVRPIGLAELVDRSESIVYGRPVARRSFLDAPTSTIWTATELVVLDGPKGSPGRTVVVTEPGGVVGDVGHLFPGVPQLELNREVVLFLYRDGGARTRILGLVQGVYPVTRAAGTGELLVQPAAAAEERLVGAESAPAAPAARDERPERRLSEFLAWIRERGTRR